MKILLTDKKALETLEKRFNINSKQLKTLRKHSKIKQIDLCYSSYTGNAIVVTTGILKYRTDNAYYKDDNGTVLGAYKILITSGLKIKIVNYRRDPRIFNHICVYFLDNPCFGCNFNEELDKAKLDRNVLFMIYQIINFLEEPGTKSEYYNINDASQAREINAKAKSQLDYFKIKYWNEKD